MQRNRGEIDMNRAVFASATFTGLVAFCLNAVALDSDLNDQNKQYHHSHPDSVFNDVNRKTKQVIRTDYRKVKERVKADHSRRYRYAEHQHRHYHHPQHVSVVHRNYRHSKAPLDSIIAIHLVAHIYHSDH